MKNGMVMYEKLYQILKKKIECGILPNGSRLPSRAELSSELGTSEKTVRRVVDMLAKEGLVETKQRQRPLITFNPAAVRKERLPALQRVKCHCGRRSSENWYFYLLSGHQLWIFALHWRRVANSGIDS